jgi:hypothetical protein
MQAVTASINSTICVGGWLMSPASSDASMLSVAVPTPLHPTLIAVDSCTRQHANLLVPGQIVSDLVILTSWSRLPHDQDANSVAAICTMSEY